MVCANSLSIKECLHSRFTLFMAHKTETRHIKVEPSDFDKLQTEPDRLQDSGRSTSKRFI